MSTNAGSPARTPITTGAVWNASDVGAHETWTCHLPSTTADSIVTTASRLHASGHALAEVRADDFALPELLPLVDSWATELARRARIRARARFPSIGSNPTPSSSPTSDSVCCSGNRSAKTATAHCSATSVTNGVPERVRPSVSTGRTNARTSTPTEPTSSVCCASTGLVRGGESRIVSSAALYNEILARDPTYWTCSTTDVLGPQRGAATRRGSVLRVAGSPTSAAAAILLHRLVHP